MSNDYSFLQSQVNSVWPEWKITRRLGKGSYGAVYEILRNDLGIAYTCAMKVLRMDSEESGQDLEEFVQKVSREIDVMMQLKGSPGVVSIEDYSVLKEHGARTILIRMEKLESVDHYIRRMGGLQRKEILQIGIDICRALESCERQSIIHRDIKLSNMFFSENAGFKLGDFGISRTMESIMEKMTMTGVGTIQYMAPEVYLGLRYDNTVDIYSLGIVLYILLNRNLPPLCRTEQPGVNGPSGSRPDMAEIHEANMRRLRGEMLPPPVDADPQLGAVICRACHPDSSRRFRSAAEFHNALVMCQRGAAIPPVADSSATDPSATVPLRYGPPQSEPYTPGPPQSEPYTPGPSQSELYTPGPSRRRPLVQPALLAAAAAVVVFGLILFAILSPGRKSSTGSSGTVASENNPGESAEDTAGNDSPGSTDAPSSAEVKGQDASDPEVYSGGSSPSAESGSSENNSSSENFSSTEDITSGDHTLSDEDSPADGSGLSGESLAGTAQTVPDADGSGLSGENTGTPSEESVPIDYNTRGHVRIMNKKSDQQHIFERLARRFSDESGIETTVESPNAGKYSQALEDGLASGSSAPTLFMLSGQTDYQKHGTECLDLTDCAAAQELTDDIYTLRGTNGHVYGLACIVESYGLTVNTHLLGKAGYEISDIRSFDDLRQIAEDITARKKELGFSAFTVPTIGSKSNGSYRFAEHAPAVPLYYELRDNDFNIGVRLTGKYVDAFMDYVDLNLNNSTVPRSQAVGHSLSEAQQEFLEEKAVFHQDGSWNADDLEAALRGEAAVIPLYMGMPGEAMQGLSKTFSYFWCVNKHASEDDIEATLQFLQWLVTSEEGLQIMAEDMDFLVPYRKAITPDNLYLQTLQEEEEAGYFPVQQYYKSGRYESWVNGINNTLTDYVNGNGSREDVREAFSALW